MTRRPVAAAEQPSGDAALDPLDQAAATPDAQLQQWIKDLDADDFHRRQQASEGLFGAGTKAVPQLEAAAQDAKPEVADRAFDMLKRHLEGDNEAAKNAAEEALKRLSEGADEGLASKAKNTLEPPQDTNPLQRFGGAIPIMPGQIQGRIQFNIQAGGAGRRVSIRNNNGNKEIEAVEGDRKVKITEAAGGKIQMQITDKKDGKEETKKYEAKNAEELKNNHPDAYKEYEKYNKGGGNIIQLRAMPLPGGGGIQIIPGGRIQIKPAAPPQAPQRPAPARDDDAPQGDAADPDKHEEKAPPADDDDQRLKDLLDRRIQRLQEQIENLKEDDADPAQRKSLEKQRKRIEQFKKSLENAGDA